MNKTQAARKKAEWLRGCLEFGWQKSDLDALSDVWDKFKDENGNMRPSTTTTVGGSVEKAGNKYAAEVMGDYSPELQEDYDSIKAHFLACAAHAQQSPSLTVDIVEALEKANPYPQEEDELPWLISPKTAWKNCCNELRELIASQPDKTDKAINELLSKITPEMQAKIDAEMKDELASQPPAPTVQGLIDLIKKLDPRKDDGSDNNKEWYKYYGSQVTGEGKESYVHSAACLIACKWAEQELFKRILDTILATPANTEGQEEQDKTCSQHKKDIAGISDMKVLAEMLGNLHYESLADLLDKLSDKLFLDAAKDRAGERRNLANYLDAAANNVHFASIQIESAWEISKPFMKP